MGTCHSGSSLDSMYKRSSDHWERAAPAPSVVLSVFPLTPSIIWVPREGRAKEELENKLLLLPLRPAVKPEVGSLGWAGHTLTNIIGQLWDLLPMCSRGKCCRGW